MKTRILIFLYLLAVVAANLLIVAFGPAVVIANSFVLVAFDLACRDALHDAWSGPSLFGKMGMLIASGSVLSYVLNRDAGPVAAASFLAFATAGASDALIYHLLRDRARLLRMNGSNVVSGLVDSVVFLSLLALLGGLPWSAVPVLVAGQWAAKAVGGALWSLVLVRVGTTGQQEMVL